MANRNARQGSNNRQEKGVPPASGPSNTKPHEASIMIMGATGSGKSTFINLLSGSKLKASDRLASCTQHIELASSFELDGHRVILIDTPGFDDTDRSDAEIFKVIAAFLEAHYKSGVKLHGIIYLHRITDNRIGGVSKRAFTVFQKLCGGDALKNTIFATTMWNKVTPEEAETRERELRTNDQFLKPALEKGAHLVRHHNTKESAQIIIRRVLGNTPLPLAIQHELVELGRPFHTTEAGREISRGIEELVQKHAKDIEALQAEIAESMRTKDKRAILELKVEQRETKAALKKTRKEAKNLTPDFRKQRLTATKLLSRGMKSPRGKNEAGGWC